MFSLHSASYPPPPPLHPPSPPIETMPPLPPTTALRSPPEQKPRKLRASCDACSRAKVKCDKVRPTCHRCGNMGVCCNYSPSMRLGKPRKPRNADGTIQRDASPAGPCPRIGTRLDMRPDMIPRTAASTTSSSPEPNDPYMYGPATPEGQFIDCPDVFMTGFEGNQSPYSDTGSFAAANWQAEDMAFHSPLESPFKFNHMMPHFPPSSEPYTPAHVRSTSIQSHPEMFRPMDGLPPSPPLPAAPYFGGMEQQQQLPLYAPAKDMVIPTPVVPAPLPSPPTSATLQSHDCTQFAFSTLNSLCTPPTAQPSACDFGASGNLPTLETVLTTNKSAIDKVFVLLGCPCSSNPHFSTTIAFTIIKILSWYQAVGGMNQPPAESPIVTQMETFSHTSTHGLESEDDTIRTQHILNELRRVEKLVDKFAERYCKTTTTNGIDGGVYGSLEHMLRTRVRDTFKVTMKHAPEDLKRLIASKTQQRARHNTIP